MTDFERSKDETIKENSDYLRGSIKEELQKDKPFFEHDNTKLLKFHGIYQQDNRDTRQQRTASKQEKEYIFMIRTKLPQGQLTPQQYLALDEISKKYTNNTLRITTRQTYQFHGVIKGNLYKTLNEINQQLVLTYGGCGDVVRNVMACPVCDIDPSYNLDLGEWAKKISNHFLPRTNSYFEIWINDEKIKLPEVTNPLTLGVDQVEPVYGKTYLPRKFKIGLAMQNDNCTDILTQDIGIVAITERSGLESQVSKLIGFNILVGGGLGFTHNKPETYPRLGSELGFVIPEKLILVLEGIVTIQRDYGDRCERKHARMKYLIDDKGLDWFENELEKRTGFKLEKLRANVNYMPYDHLGWKKQLNGNWYLGIFIENGRIADKEGKKIKTALKEIIERFSPNIRNSPQQNIILTNIKEKDKSKIDKILENYGLYIVNKNLSPLRRNSIACVALPTCGLALAEAERALPGIIDELERLGFGDEEISFRMSGCPNSCSRPPVSEIGIIGMSANKYNIYVGGNMEGTRINKLYAENVRGEDMVSEITKLLNVYRKNKLRHERFGDFSNRFGLDELKALVNKIS